MYFLNYLFLLFHISNIKICAIFFNLVIQCSATYILDIIYDTFSFCFYFLYYYVHFFKYLISFVSNLKISNYFIIQFTIHLMIQIIIFLTKHDKTIFFFLFLTRKIEPESTSPKVFHEYINNLYMDSKRFEAFQIPSLEVVEM